MGQEQTHFGKVKWKCPSCGRDLSVEITVWEYPVGTIEHVDSQVQGGEFLKDPELEITPVDY